jgi:hypothetical protein
MTKLFLKRLKKLSKAKLIIFILIGSICLLSAVQVRADKNPVEVKIPATLNSGLHHFLELVDPEKNVSFDTGLVAGVMEFLEAPKDDGTLYFADGILGLASAYHEFDSHADLQKVSDYAFNPDIPAIATMPSSVRLFYWLDEKGHRRPSPPVNRYLYDSSAINIYYEIDPGSPRVRCAMFK